jgi:hypothetical protein
MIYNLRIKRLDSCLRRNDKIWIPELHSRTRVLGRHIGLPLHYSLLAMTIYIFMFCVFLVLRL